MYKYQGDAVYDPNFGLICYCDDWTTGEDVNHIPLSKDKRFVFNNEAKEGDSLWI
jgi:hypothetical protein